MKHVVKFTALVCCSLAAASLFAEITTGWIQTGAGPYDYNDTRNWANGVINGVFSSDLELTAAQTITFSQDTTLPDGLKIAYSGTYRMYFMTAAEAKGEVTLKLQGGILLDTVDNGNVMVDFGSSTDGRGVLLDLDGAVRTVETTGTKHEIRFLNKITNGGITLKNKSKVTFNSTESNYTLGTTFNGSGQVVVMQDSLGTGPLTFNATTSLGTSGNRTFTNNNKLIFNAGLTVSGANGSLNLGAGDIVINEPISISMSKNTFTLGGQIAENSPYGIDAISFADVGGTLVTYANLVADGDVELSTAKQWDFHGVISGSGRVIKTGGGEMDLFAQNTFTGKFVIRGGKVRFRATNVFPSPDGMFLVEEAGELRSNSGAEAGYLTVPRMLYMVDKASTGALGIDSGSESENIDLSDYPGVRIATSGGNVSYTGNITAPSTGILRLGGGGKTLKIGGNIIGATEIDASTGSIQFDVSQPNFDGTITCGPGYTLTVGSSVELANADLVSDGGTIRFASATADEFTRARSVTLKTAHLTIDSPSAGATTHKITGALIVDVCTEAAGGIPSVTLANSGAYDLVLSAGSVSKAFDAGMLHVMNSVTGDGTAKFILENTDELGLVGSGALNTPYAPISPFVRVNNSIATYEANVGFRALNSNEYVLFNETYEGPITPEGANILVSGGVTVTVNSPSRINSVMLSSIGTAHPVLQSASASLAVFSGAVAFMSTSTADTSCPQCSAELDFGTRRAYISAESGRYCKISSAMHGTGGIIVAECAPTAHESIGIHLRSVDSDISGDSYVFGCVLPKASVDTKNYPAYSTSAFFPCGTDRPGNLYVYGRVRLVGGGLPINGLYGGGAIECSGSGQSAIYVGCDGSDGEFTGSFVDNGTGANLHAYKYGTGKQRYTANMGWKYSSFDPGAGELQLDGSLNMLNGGIGIGANLTLSGCTTVAAKSGNKISFKSGSILAPGSAEMPGKPMTFKNEVEMQDGASMKFYIGADRASQAIVAEGYGITGTAETIPVTVDCTVKKKGAWLLLEAGTFNGKAFAFTTRPAGGRLVVKTDETTNRAQLWFEQTTGFSVTLR